MVEILLGLWINFGFVCFLVMVLIIVFLIEGMSNVVAVVVLMLVGFVLAVKYGIDLRVMILGIIVLLGLVFLLLVSILVMVIIMGSGYVLFFEVFKCGLLLKLVGILIFLVMVKFYWFLFGLGV